MAQLPIREYDAKRLRSVFSNLPYVWVLVDAEQQLQDIVSVLKDSNPDWLRVVKPDQLFWKRGKYGLVGVKLDATWVRDRLTTHRQEQRTLNGVTDLLDTFLIEPFMPHEGEYYISLSTEREYDLIRFSVSWWIDIEENWASVREVRVGVLEQLGEEHLVALLGMDRHAEFIKHQGGLAKTGEVEKFIYEFFQFFRQYGFVSLEVNPFVLSADGRIVCLDMVAKVDSCEAWRQKEREKYICRVKPFGTRLHPSEALVESVDEKTGASLKLTIINPEGRLWFLLWGGGASVIVMDTMTQRVLLHEVANYGELSWNPDEESNRAYVTTLIETMLANGKSGQYLGLIWGIANFTDIVALVKPLCTVLKEYASVLVERNITILMRRGGLRVEQAMHLLEKTCTELWIAYKIYDDEQYLTKIFDEVRL